ncbi:MAG TPA: V-type ATP synthase subunit F [Clostridiales bacterium]|nr:V-type ATP synthase subunit F [Clostridiales bacterium]
MFKIGIIGDKDSIMGFKATGMDAFYGEDKAQIEALIDRLAYEQYAVLFMTEKAFEMATEKVAEFDNHMTPAIIPVPGISGNTGIGMNSVRRSVEKAVGADIFFDD